MNQPNQNWPAPVPPKPVVTIEQLNTSILDLTTEIGRMGATMREILDHLTGPGAVKLEKPKKERAAPTKNPKGLSLEKIKEILSDGVERHISEIHRLVSPMMPFPIAYTKVAKDALYLFEADEIGRVRTAVYKSKPKED